MVKPNFFFIGAPKCGTTSIAYHLSQHPNIFISNPKEPHFFEKEISRGINSLKAYESLFSRAKKHHQIVGEASTGYLYSKAAVPEINSYSPNAKFLVSLRNPYEMAISLHGQALRGQYENQYNFNIAWKIQESRRKGLDIPKKCISSLLLLYEDRCALGDQIERLYNIADSDNICLVFFEDLKNDPNKLYNKIYKFLGIQPIENTNFPVMNKKKLILWPFLANTAKFLGKTKRALGIYKSLGIANKIVEFASTSKIEKPIIQDEVWNDMDYKFIPQIKKIEYFSGADLTYWYHYRVY